VDDWFDEIITKIKPIVWINNLTEGSRYLYHNCNYGTNDYWLILYIYYMSSWDTQEWEKKKKKIILNFFFLKIK